MFPVNGFSSCVNVGRVGLAILWQTNERADLFVGRFVYLETSLDREKAARRLPEGPSQEVAFFWRANTTPSTLGSWSTWSAVINLTSRTGELRAHPVPRTPFTFGSLSVPSDRPTIESC